MAYGLFDAEENNLIAVGWQDICVRFHWVHPVTTASCRESDAFIKAHLHDNKGEPLEYRCKNSMIDIANQGGRDHYAAKPGAGEGLGGGAPFRTGWRFRGNTSGNATEGRKLSTPPPVKRMLEMGIPVGAE